MSLGPGTRLGPYEIQSAIGAGGMGEVYRARDTKLGREVAIKVLPASLTSDPDRLARFQREAQVLAALNHPNIAAIHHVEETSDGPALVMELVEGETLADRIARGSIPADEALAIAKQIAEALEAAHEQGIIHRDLKPANIKVRPDGTVKVLDFGLAKLNDPNVSNVATGPIPLSLSPTITSPALMTGVGVLLGTAAYMSPEQAKGRPADKRSDIWAFGCVLYEMLTTRPPFPGDDITETIAAIVKSDPDWDTLPAHTPRSIHRLIQRCLEKDPRRRLRDIGDTRLILEDVDQPVPTSTTGQARSLVVVAIGLLLAAVGAAAYVGWRATPRQNTSTSVQFSISIPDGDSFPIPPRISPDGRYVALAVADGALESEIWLRPIDAAETRVLPGTATTEWISTLWSPDSRYIAFGFRKLMKAPVDGGPPQAFVNGGPTFVGVPGGAAWAADGTVLISNGNGIWRASTANGPAVQVTRANPAAGETQHSWPQFLPDGHHFLYYARNAENAKSAVLVASLDGDAPRLILRNTATAVYAEPGYLLYSDTGKLMAQKFETDRLTLAGEPRSLGLDAMAGEAGDLHVSVSRNGTLVTAVARNTDAVLAWVDRRGGVIRRYEQAGRYHDLTFSPNGARLSLNQASATTHEDVWTMDLARGALTRLTSSPNDEWVSAWSPDDRTLAFTRDTDLYTMPADGSSAPSLLRKNATLTWATDWTPDGRFLICQTLTERGGWDVVAVKVESPHDVVPIADSEFMETQPRISGDGRWIAFTSTESGHNEVYVQPFAQSGGKTRVSIGGGSNPRWRRDGRELYYVARDASLVAVGVDLSRTPPIVGEPQVLFKTNHLSRSYAGSDYVPAVDGQRFLLTMPAAAAPPASVIVTINWLNLLNQKPTD